MPKPISYYVKSLLDLVGQMQKDYSKKKFTLDGRLVGDIGEILTEQIYDLDLLDGLQHKHDAISDGRLVQVKTTMKDSLTFGDIPDFYLGIRINTDGTVEEIFNGPGSLIWDSIKNRKRPRNFLISISLSRLRKLNALVQPQDKIKERNI